MIRRQRAETATNEDLEKKKDKRGKKEVKLKVRVKKCGISIQNRKHHVLKDLTSQQKKEDNLIKSFSEHLYHLLNQEVKLVNINLVACLCAAPCDSQRASLCRKTSLAHSTPPGYPVKGRCQLLLTTLTSSQPITCKAVSPLE